MSTPSDLMPYTTSTPEGKKPRRHIGTKLALVAIAGASSVFGLSKMEQSSDHTRDIPVATAEALAQNQKLERDIEAGTPVSYIHGNLISINPDGESRVVVNPIVMPKPGIKTPGTDALNDYTFYALVATLNEGSGKVTVKPQEIDPDSSGFSTKLDKARFSGSAIQTVLEPSGEELIDSISLYNPDANGPNTMYGFNAASFDYHVLGDRYFTPRLSNNSSGITQAPIGVLLQGQSIDHQ